MNKSTHSTFCIFFTSLRMKTSPATNKFFRMRRKREVLKTSNLTIWIVRQLNSTTSKNPTEKLIAKGILWIRNLMEKVDWELELTHINQMMRSCLNQTHCMKNQTHRSFNRVLTKTLWINSSMKLWMIKSTRPCHLLKIKSLKQRTDSIWKISLITQVYPQATVTVMHLTKNTMKTKNQFSPVKN